jgi:hypothetical protein
MLQDLKNLLFLLELFKSKKKQIISYKIYKVSSRSKRMLIIILMAVLKIFSENVSIKRLEKYKNKYKVTNKNIHLKNLFKSPKTK